MALKPVGARLILENEGGFIRGMNKAGSAVTGFEGTTQKASAGAIAMGTTLGTLATGGLALVGRGIAKVSQVSVGFLSDSIVQAQGLEAQMSGVAAVLGATEGELTQLNGLVKDLGLDPNLKVSSLEAAEAIEVLAKNGLNVTQIMDGAAKSTVALANATGANMAVAADVATDAMSQFGITAANMETAIDGITGVTTKSKFNINDYALAIANSGKIAAETGIGFDDFNTILAASASAFSSGADAGTSLKTTIQRLANPTAEIQETMTKLGISLFDSSGKTRAMSEVVGQLNVAFAGMTDAQKANTAAVLGGADASRTILSLASLTKTEFEALSASVNASGQAQASAAERVNNLAGAMDILGGVVEAIQLAIGQAFLPVLTKLATLVSGFLEENSAQFIAFFETVAQGITTFTDGLLNGVGPVLAFATALTAIGIDESIILRFQDFINVVENIATPIIAFVQDHAEAFKGALIAIGAVLAGAGVVAGVLALGSAVALLASPVGIVITAVGLLGAAWAENWGGIREKTAEVIGFIRPFITAGIAAIRKVFDDNWVKIQAVVLTAWEVIRAAVTSAINIIRPAIDEFVSNFQKGFKQFEPLVADFQKLWVALKPVVEGVLLALGAAFLALVGTAAGMVRGISQAIGPLVRTIANVVGGIVQVLTGLSEFITGFVQLIFGLFQGNSEMIQEAWGKMGDGLLNIAEGFIRAIIGGVTGFVETIFHLISGLVTGVIDFFKGMSEELIGESVIPNMIQDILKAMSQFALDFVRKLQEMMVAAIETLKAGFSEFVAAGRAMIDAIVQGIREVAGNLPAAIQAAIQEAALITVTLFQQIKETASLIWQQMIDGILEKTGEMAQNIKSGFQEMAENGIRAISDMSRGVVDAVSNMGRKFIDAIREMIDKAKEFFTDTIETFTEIGKDMMGGMIDGIKSMAKKLKDSALGVVTDAVNKTKDFLGIGSPSKVFREVGRDVISGMILGLRDSFGELSRAAESVGRVFTQSVEKRLLGTGGGSVSQIMIATGKNIAKAISALDTDKVFDSIEAQLELLEFARQSGFRTTGATSIEQAIEQAVRFLEGISTQAQLSLERQFLGQLNFGDFLSDLEQARKAMDELISGRSLSVSGAAGGIAKFFQSNIISPLFEQISALDEDVGIATERFLQTSPDSDLVRFYKRFLGINLDERARATNDLADAQERIFRIQEKQARLDFLGEQQKLLDLIEKNELDRADILGGLTLGLQADTGKLLDAMGRALDAIITKTEAELEVSSPSRVFQRIGQNIIAGLQAGIASEGGVSIPATAAQITNRALTQVSTRTINVEYNNNSGLPLADAGELDFLLASYA